MMPGLALRRARLLAQLSARPPAYVLIGVNDRNGMEPSDSAAELRAFPQLQRIVQARYAMDRRIGDFLLMRRRTM
jgi:hypothetical protein